MSKDQGKRFRTSEATGDVLRQPSPKRPAMLTREDEDRLCTRLMANFQQMLSNEMVDIVRKADLSTIHQDVQALLAAEAENRNAVKELKVENGRLKKQLNDIERRLRQDRLIIRGLSFDRDEDPKQIAANFLSAFPGVGTVEIRSTSHVKTPSGTVAFVQLMDEHKIPVILKNAKLDKKAGLSIVRDMHPEARRSCNRMLRLRWELKKCAPTAQLRLAYDRLWVDDRCLEWDGDSLVCGAAEGAEILKQVTGTDWEQKLEEIVRFRPPGLRGST